MGGVKRWPCRPNFEFCIKFRLNIDPRLDFKLKNKYFAVRVPGLNFSKIKQLD